MQATAYRPVWVLGGLVLLACLIAGCDNPSTSLGSPFTAGEDLGQFFGAASDWPAVTEAETNDMFDLATLADPAADHMALSGQIPTLDDIDVYDLGPVYRGDRIVVSTAVSGSLDATAAVFDDKQCLIFANDDRSWRIDNRPYIDVIVREDSNACYLAIAAADDSTGTGSYTMRVQITGGHAVPETEPQVVLLDFDGARGVEVGNTGPMAVPALDAADIDPSLAGKTDDLIDAIEQTVRDDYEGYHVEIFSTAEGTIPNGPYTTVYFGTYNPALLGLADYVDYYNEDLTQEAIVFAETFALFMPYRPTVDELGQVLGNVASHEIGHLLGLNHTQEPTELMDTSATAGQMLHDQDFHIAPLHQDVFPIGYQDPDAMLAETVGRG